MYKDGVFNVKEMPLIEWSVLMPILIVIGAGLLALIIEMLRPKKNNNVIVAVSLLGLAAAGFELVMQFGWAPEDTIARMVVRDPFGLAMQLLIVVATFLCVLFSEGYLREKRIPFGEFYPLVLWSASGAMIMASSENLLMIFLGVEVLSIALYVLAGLSRQENKSEESALKYFLLGAFASGFLLYGIAWIYGATGSLHLEAIGYAWSHGTTWMQSMLLIGIGMTLIGLSFKAAFVPFHQWTPDVYQGAPTNITAFMAAVSKIAAVAVLFRFFGSIAPAAEIWVPVMFWIAIATMTVANLIALAQRDVKRILGYSSIAHAGYILVGLLASAKSEGAIGFGTTVYYLGGYLLMTVGAFAVVSLCVRGGAEGTRLEHLNGLYKRAPWAAVMMVIFVASLIGVPPTAGFFGKFQIFQDALSAGLTPLAIVLAVNSVISVAYYLGIAKACFVNDESTSPSPMMKPSAGVQAAITLCAAGVLAVAIFAGSVSDFFRQDLPRPKVVAAKVEPTMLVGKTE